jgi:hypothetical protein
MARGFYNYNALSIVPCPCGSREPYWHGPEDGRREYCCDECWKKMQEAKGRNGKS